MTAGGEGAGGGARPFDGTAWLDLPGPGPLAWCALVRVAADAPGAPAAGPAIDPGEALARLHPDERRAGAGLSAGRRRDWAAGRLALHAALERRGAAPGAIGAIGADDRGAPRLPRGWVGSISHKRGLAVAVAAADDGWTVGVDVELDAAPRVDVARRVLTAAERAAVDALPPEARAREVVLHFALKEAVYKAVDPHVRRYVGFAEVELALAPAAGAAEGAARATSALPLALELGWRRVAGLVVATARARPR